MTKRREKEKLEPNQKRQWPRWVWWTLFLLPLLASELMFYVGGRGWSMLIFPLAWIGFWYTTMDRVGWPILPPAWRKRSHTPDEPSEGGRV